MLFLCPGSSRESTKESREWRVQSFISEALCAEPPIEGLPLPGLRSIIFWAIDYNDSSEVQFALRTRWGEEKKLRMTTNKKKFTLDETIMEYKLFNE